MWRRRPGKHRGRGALSVQTYRYQSTLGPLFYSAPLPQPETLLVPGFMRHMADVRRWEQVFPGLGFLHLPGQDGAPFIDETWVQAWAIAFDELIGNFREPPCLIGESLGAVLALSLKSRRVVALEPLLSTDNLWPLQNQIADARRTGIEIKPELEALFSEPSDWVLDRIASPTLVLAGAEPLMPVRETRRAPSLLSDDDLRRYGSHPLVTIHRVPGGHALLDTSPAEVAQLAHPFLKGPH